MIPLTRLQKEILAEFYGCEPAKVLLRKTERDDLWNKAKTRSPDLDFENLRAICPALEHQIRKSYASGRNIQSAVFSECVYAQTLANLFSLDGFVICSQQPDFLPASVCELLHSYGLMPRYAYFNEDTSRLLIQAGSCNGIDSALITVVDLNIYTIEFKEPGAKTSEPDLPKYGEDGVLRITEAFLGKYPQFEPMLREQEGLNFFEHIGSNINTFSPASVQFAVSGNYVKKYADVVCTEDKNGYLVMMPANQLDRWGEIEGEIRPAGRNHYEVWTPEALRRFLSEMGAEICENIVTVSRSQLKERKARGGGGTVSGYKINSLFFVYSEDCEVRGDGCVSFDLRHVQQLNPTIAGKVFFSELDYREVQAYYENLFG